MTKGKQEWRTKKAKANEKYLDSSVDYPRFKWAPDGTNDYFEAIDDINEAYRKMIMIGGAKAVFRDKVCPMMTAKTKEEFKKAKYNINQKYWNHIRANKTVLPNITVDTEYVPDPRKYGPGKTLPTRREILAKEKILTFEHDMANLNMFMCSQCKECQIESKPATGDMMHVCKACKKRDDPDYYIKNNLHPVWYLVDDVGNFVLDEKGNKVPQYHIPEELSCLSMYEKLLIRRCANFVPSVHLRNGVFGIKGHCVTFPQDITGMCDELPQRKETLVTFIRNIGNKDTEAVFPTSLRVNRIKVVNALRWLQKHNPFYKNITIKEENLDWMNGEDEVNLGTDGVELTMKESSRSKMKENEVEHISNAHSTEENGEDDEIPIRTAHANTTAKVPSGRQAQQIKELVDIAHETGQTSKIMNFPPIDHESAIS